MVVETGTEKLPKRPRPAHWDPGTRCSYQYSPRRPLSPGPGRNTTSLEGYYRRNLRRPPVQGHDFGRGHNISVGTERENTRYSGSKRQARSRRGRASPRNVWHGSSVANTSRFRRPKSIDVGHTERSPIQSIQNRSSPTRLNTLVDARSQLRQSNAAVDAEKVNLDVINFDEFLTSLDLQGDFLAPSRERNEQLGSMEVIREGTAVWSDLVWASPLISPGVVGGPASMQTFPNDVRQNFSETEAGDLSNLFVSKQPLNISGLTPPASQDQVNTDSIWRNKSPVPQRKMKRSNSNSSKKRPVSNTPDEEIEKTMKKRATTVERSVRNFYPSYQASFRETYNVSPSKQKKLSKGTTDLTSEKVTHHGSSQPGPFSGSSSSRVAPDSCLSSSYIPRILSSVPLNPKAFKSIYVSPPSSSPPEDSPTKKQSSKSRKRKRALPIPTSPLEIITSSTQSVPSNPTFESKCTSSSEFVLDNTTVDELLAFFQRATSHAAILSTNMVSIVDEDEIYDKKDIITFDKKLSLVLAPVRYKENVSILSIDRDTSQILHLSGMQQVRDEVDYKGAAHSLVLALALYNEWIGIDGWIYSEPELAENADPFNSSLLALAAALYRMFDLQLPTPTDPLDTLTWQHSLQHLLHLLHSTSPRPFLPSDPRLYPQRSLHHASSFDGYAQMHKSKIHALTPPSVSASTHHSPATYHLALLTHTSALSAAEAALRTQSAILKVAELALRGVDAALYGILAREKVAAVEAGRRERAQAVVAVAGNGSGKEASLPSVESYAREKRRSATTAGKGKRREETSGSKGKRDVPQVEGQRGKVREEEEWEKLRVTFSVLADWEAVVRDWEARWKHRVAELRRDVEGVSQQDADNEMEW